MLSFGIVIVCPLRPRCARPPLPKGEARDAQKLCHTPLALPPGELSALALQNRSPASAGSILRGGSGKISEFCRLRQNEAFSREPTRLRGRPRKKSALTHGQGAVKHAVPPEFRAPAFYGKSLGTLQDPVTGAAVPPNWKHRSARKLGGDLRPWLHRDLAAKRSPLWV